MAITDDAARAEPAAVFAGVLYWVLVPALVLSIVGLALVIVGAFYPITLVAIGLPASVLLGMVARAPFRRAASQLIRGGAITVAMVVVVIVGSALSAGVFSGEHVLTNRDPGVYLVNGRWLADAGTLEMPGAVGGFAGIEEITAAHPGYEPSGEDTLAPQFLHLLPAWAAAAHWIAGDQALFRVNAAIIALAIAAVWLFAATVMRPWFAVLATASFAVLLPTVHFARDLYTEPLALLFIFGALAFLTFAASAEHPRLSLVAGLMVGAVTMSRIDGWLVVIAVVGYLMIVWWTAQERAAQPMITRFVHPALLGILISGSVGLLDGMLRTRVYFTIHRSRIMPMLAVLLLVVVVGWVALRFPDPFRRLAAWLTRHRSMLAWVVPLAIVVVATLFILRPFFQETHGGSADPSVESLQQLEGLSIDGTRTYHEQAMRWLSWYLGIFGLAFGVVGVAWAWRQAILGVRGLWPFLLTFSSIAAVYVFKPSITADQLWAMRRFLPIVLPGLIIGAVLATQWASDRMSRTSVRGATIAVATVALVVIPMWITAPLASSTSYVGMHDAVQQVCVAAPEGSAVLLTTRFAGRFQAPIRSFCGIPVSGIRSQDIDASCVIAKANEAWADLGVNLLVGYRDEIELEPEVAIAVDYELPEFTLSRRPDRLITQSFSMNLADADGVDASACF